MIKFTLGFVFAFMLFADMNGVRDRVKLEFKCAPYVFNSYSRPAECK